MKKVAIPVIEDKICSHFGGAQSFIIYTTEDYNIKEKNILNAPQHEPGMFPNWIISQKVTDLIAQGIGQKAIEILNQKNVNVHAGVKITDPEQIIQHFLKGNLETNMNLCDH